MTLKDGKTPGAMRQGAAAIEVCLASGCRIYPNPLNRIPDEYQQHVLDLNNDMGRSTGYDDDSKQVEGTQRNIPTPKSKRGRPRKVKQ